MVETKQTEERVILVAVRQSDDDNTDRSLDELEELASTAGAVTVTRIIQNREAIHPGTYVGKGKIEEIRDAIYMYDATGIICDDELSPAQMANLEEALEVKIMDRTLVILDIFAARANTGEGKIQVELAQLKYRATRLVGLRSSLSRLGGGIGTRGPGETKLEMDRRLIHQRIAQLKRELADVITHRELTRNQRKRAGVPVIAIVGYTNAGKSTLLNTLTGADVLEEDKLFATLDPTTRSLTLESGQEVLLTDTVGFIRKLPHHLVEAFKSTLEEAKYSDVILHVVDASDPNWDRNMETVYATLRQLNVDEEKDHPIITVFNKIDKLPEGGDISMIKDLRADRMVYLSAKTGAGIDDLLVQVEEVLREQKTYIRHTFAYQDAGKPGLIRKYGEVLTEEYLEDGIFVEAYVPKSLIGQLGLDKNL